jgi:radical SAM-linked protein
VRRAGIPVAFSKGFHPHPRLSFDQALPVGMESLCEEGWIGLYEYLSPAEILEKWNGQLPEGIKIKNVNAVPKKGRDREGSARVVIYRVEGLKSVEIDKLRRLWQQKQGCIVPIARKKITTEVNLDRCWKAFEAAGDQAVTVAIRENHENMLRLKDLLLVAGIGDEKMSGELRVIKFRAYDEHEYEERVK